MCGIIAAISNKDVTSVLMEGLQRLEYRGYDSAGLAVVDHGKIHRLRTVGKVNKLVAQLQKTPISGQIGIAHTRWATHGPATENNAHPHMSADQLAIVHNGIIENFAELRESLKSQGVECVTDTDTEVVAHLLQHEVGETPIESLKHVAQKLQGAYALVIMSAQYPDTLFTIRSGSPMVIGVGKGENFVASDALSLLPETNRFIYLEEGDMAEITRDAIKIFDAHGTLVERKIETLDQSADTVSKGQYKHYMLKEIFEQPQAVQKTLAQALNPSGQVNAASFGAAAAKILSGIEQVKIVACGTSYHAGLVAKHWLESWVKMPCDVEIASEFRYRDAVVLPNTLMLTLSQSGETADTLAALRESKKRGFVSSLCICNVPNSSLVRESDMVFLTQAGPEVGVASTKAFTTQLTALYLLTLLLGQLKQVDAALLNDLSQALQQLPEVLTHVLNTDDAIEVMAHNFVDKPSCLFLGRGVDYPIAMEGALKLKEISYIHAESYPAGELKHGPLALVDKNLPVVVIAPGNTLFHKIQANIQEVSARGGDLYVVTETDKDIAADHQIRLPKVPQSIAPIMHTVPLQLLAYHVAVIKGNDVDQPRNLAKSVTVE